MKTWQTLGYMGLIPFIACLYLSSYEWMWEIAAKQAFIAYSAVILSFMAGTLWQINERLKQNKQQIISNIFCLLAFLSLLVSEYVALSILATSYVLLVLYEKQCARQTKLNPDYTKMRYYLTLIVVLLHIAAFIIWFS